MATRPTYMAVQGAALIVGTVFLVIGIFGFVPGATRHYELLDWAGQHSGAKLFGVFLVSGLTNALHLATGALGIIFARTYAASRAYLLLGGLGYAGLWAYGLIVDEANAQNILPISAANNWLNFGCAVLMLLLGVTLGAQHDPTKPRRKLPHYTPRADRKAKRASGSQLG